jgi:CheY-like chemotaxis protein
LFLPREYVSSRAVTPGTMKKQRTVHMEAHGHRRKPFSTELVLDEESAIVDDRIDIQEGDRVVLIVEDDPSFANILLDLAREKGFKCLVAQSGNVALALAQKYTPAAITLDIKLPDRNGWTILDRLKHDPRTRHIPVHVISVEEQRRRALRQGASTLLKKPVTNGDLSKTFDQISEFLTREWRELLLVEDDDAQRMSLVELIGNGDVRTTAVGTGQEALKRLKEQRFDCMVLDLKLPDMSGFELIEQLQTDPARSDLPIIIYTGKELTRKEENHLRRVATSVIIKEADSPERLLA